MFTPRITAEGDQAWIVDIIPMRPISRSEGRDGRGETDWTGEYGLIAEVALREDPRFDNEFHKKTKAGQVNSKHISCLSFCSES